MGVAARDEPPGVDVVLLLRVKKLRIDKPTDAATTVAAGDQHFSVSQQGCAVVLAGGIDGPRQAEGAGARGRRPRHDREHGERRRLLRCSRRSHGPIGGSRNSFPPGRRRWLRSPAARA